MSSRNVRLVNTITKKHSILKFFKEFYFLFYVTCHLIIFCYFELFQKYLEKFIQFQWPILLVWCSCPSKHHILKPVFKLKNEHFKLLTTRFNLVILIALCLLITSHKKQNLSDNTTCHAGGVDTHTPQTYSRTSHLWLNFSLPIIVSESLLEESQASYTVQVSTR